MMVAAKQGPSSNATRRGINHLIIFARASMEAEHEIKPLGNIIGSAKCHAETELNVVYLSNRTVLKSIKKNPFLLCANNDHRLIIVSGKEDSM